VTAIMKDCVFEGNTAGKHGGAVQVEATPPSSGSNLSSATIEDSVFTGNVAKKNGGGIHTDNYEMLSVKNITFASNKAEYASYFDMSDTAMVSTYQMRVGALVSLSLPFDNASTDNKENKAYNNYDINYCAELDPEEFIIFRQVTYNPNYQATEKEEKVYYGSDHEIKAADHEELGFDRKGYEFMGWSTTSGGSVVYDPGDELLNIVQDVELFAVWRALPQKVTYYANNGTTANYEVPTTFDASYTILDNSDSNLLFTKTGYTFDGWATSADGAVDPDYDGGKSITIQSDVQLFAKWKANPQTVTYYANNGTATDYVDNTTYDATYTILDNSDSSVVSFAKTGYTFDGWATSSGGTADPAYDPGEDISISGNVELWAVWKANPQTVTYYPDNGTTDKYTDNTTYDATYTILDNSDSHLNFSREGYTFDGWTTTQGGSKNVAYDPGEDISISGNVELWAVWKANPQTVTYYANNGTTTEAIDTTEYDENYTVLDNSNPGLGFTHTNYTFIGWSLTEDGSADPVYAPGQSIVIKGDVKLYAVWKGEPRIVTYHANNGSSDTYPDDTEFASRYAVRDNDEPSLGFSNGTDVFMGWSTSPGGLVEFAPDDEFIVSVNVDLYAVWAPTHEYAIEYHFDDEHDPSLTETGRVLENAVIDTYPDKVKDGYKLDRVENHPLTVSTVAANNVINVYYVADVEPGTPGNPTLTDNPTGEDDPSSSPSQGGNNALTKAGDSPVALLFAGLLLVSACILGVALVRRRHRA